MTGKKVILLILLFAACMFMAINCDLELNNNIRSNEKKSNTKNGSVTFGFNPQSSDSRAGISPADISAAILTVKNAATGDMVLENRRMNLIRFNSSYVSDTIQFMEGDYELTEFLVVDAVDNTLYAAPLEGSPKAGLIEDPLPGGCCTTPKENVAPLYIAW